MLDTHVNEHGFTGCLRAYIVNAETMTGAASCRFRKKTCSRGADAGGKGGEVRDALPDSDVGVSLTNFVRDTMVDAAKLPVRLTATLLSLRPAAMGATPAAPSASISSTKVEMVYIYKPEESRTRCWREMTGNAESCRSWACRTASCCCAPVTWASAPRPTIWKCGCRRRTPIANFELLELREAFRAAARALATGRRRQERAGAYTERLGSRRPGRTLVAIRRTTRMPMVRLPLPEVLRVWVASSHSTNSS